MIHRPLSILGFGIIMLIPRHHCDAQLVTVSGKVAVERVLASNKHPDRPDNSKVVIWLASADPSSRVVTFPTNGQLRLTQKDKSFVPSLLIVPVGSSIEFPNHDPFFHNVFSLFNGKRFDLGLYEAGSSRSVKFDREGVSYIFCNIHPEMHAVVIALETPFFARSDVAGSFSIPDVPPGSYQLHVWYEHATPKVLQDLDQMIAVSGKRMELPPIRLVAAQELSAEHKNKFGKDYDRLPPTPLY